MKINCNFHPTQPAHFMCGKCGGEFCRECISERANQIYGRNKTAYFCPKCNIPANNLGVGNILQPFWQRIPSFFLYPLQIQPLIFMLILTIIATVFPTSGIVKLLLGVVLIKYSYSVLANTAKGNLKAPKDIVNIISGDINIVFKQAAIYIAIGFLIAVVLSSFGAIAALAVTCLAVYSLPAMFMALAATDSLIQALNPMVFIRIALRIGWPYLLMYLFLLLMAGGPAALAPYLVGTMPPQVQFFVFTMAEQYYTIMTYNLLGYVLLQYHEEVGYEVDYEVVHETSAPSKASVEKGATPAPQDDTLSKEIEVLIKDGRIDDAIIFIKNETQGKFKDLSFAKKYYDLLKIAKRTPELLEHCKTYIDLLAQKSKFTEAYRIYNECLAQDPKFTPKPEGLYKIIEWLSRSGNATKAINMAVAFVEINPQHGLTPDAHFLVAQVLHERLNDLVQAKKILTSVIKRYPDHNIADKARGYLLQLESPTTA